MPLKILVVDDQADSRKTLTILLEEMGISYIEAFNGEDGLNKLNNNKDIIMVITDLEMPVMNGEELLKRIKIDDKLNHIPVTFYSSKWDNKIGPRLKGLGASMFLPKPMKGVSMLKNIIEVVTKKKLD